MSYRRTASPSFPRKNPNMKSKSALGPIARDFVITGRGDVGQALASTPPIVHAAEAEFALKRPYYTLKVVMVGSPEVQTPRLWRSTRWHDRTETTNQGSWK